MSYKFTGAQTNRNTGGNILLQPTEYTVACWVKPSQVIFTKCISMRSAGGSGYSHEMDQSSVFYHYTYQGSAVTITGTTQLVANTWYHCAITAKNGDYIQLWVNGLEEGAKANATTLWASGDDFWTPASSGLGSAPFEGELAEYCIWYKQLLPNELMKLAMGRVRGIPQTIQPDYLYLYYPMNDVAEGSIKTTDWKDLNTKSVLTQTRTNNVTGVGDIISYP